MDSIPGAARGEANESAPALKYPISVAGLDTDEHVLQARNELRSATQYQHASGNVRHISSANLGPRPGECKSSSRGISLLALRGGCGSACGAVSAAGSCNLIPSGKQFCFCILPSA
jgi:hypothetical protein